MEAEPSSPPHGTLHIRDLKTISRSLWNVIRTSFGPKGQQTLITSSTGQVITTRDGISILSALHLSHPVAKCIMDSVHSFTKVYGDGSKILILYICELLSAIEASAASLDFGHSNSAEYKKAASRYMREFLCNDLPQICSHLREYNYVKNCQELSKQRKVFENPMSCLIQSCLSGTLSTHIVQEFSGLITELLTDTDNPWPATDTISRFFDSCVYTVSGQPFSKSFVGNGAFLQGSFHGELPSASEVKIMLLQCPMEGAVDSKSSASVSYTSNAGESVLTYRMQTTKTFLTNIKNAGVSVIITTQSVPKYALQICSCLNISVLACVDENDVEFLTYVTSVLPVTSVYDVLSETNIMAVTSVEKVNMSGKSFLGIKSVRYTVKWMPKCVFLCAQTQAMCQQLKLSVRKCVRVVSQYLTGSDSLSVLTDRAGSLCPVAHNHDKISSDNKHNCSTCTESIGFSSLISSMSLNDKSWKCRNIIAGGGCFEKLFAYFLQSYNAEGETPPQVKFCCEVLMKMLQAVPKILYDSISPNSVRFSHCHAFLNANREMNKMLSQQMITGFNMQGKVCNPLEFLIVDVLSIKIAAVFHVLELVVTLLRVDSIVGIKAKEIADTKQKKDGSDSDDGG